ncbi:neutral zinc metallopeptidase [Nocardia puris]|uniref:Putative metalloprotease n=1 Tax=Nocardia puris TaxID=208602 RepID=A0A366DJQ8_9NOCA|nr:metallopeptidase [Nocardia puris]RBO90317.1 putative metalloprotease [Nocardia puris]
MRTKRLRFAAVAALVAGVALAGCASSGGTSTDPALDPDNPWLVAGAASSTGPSGPRSGVPDTTLQAENGDGGAVDRLALNAIADVEDFWKAEYGKHFEGEFQPASKYISWNAREDEGVDFCKTDTYKFVNAAYCRLDHSIGWDRGVLLPLIEEKFGPMAVVMVLAHEYGHAIQGKAKMTGFFSGALVKEQQADCLAGVFLRHVAEGDSAHFTLNMTDGLDGVLGATIAVRDADPSDPDNVHGSAFERVTAVQLGYTDGAGACKEIDRKEIEERRGNLPVTFEVDDEENQQLPVDRDSLESVAQALAKNFPLREAPTFDYTGVTTDCSGVTTTEPVSYCPDTNTIGTDIPDLAERGGPLDGTDEPLTAVVQGDYNAFVVFVSRYMLAVQQERGLDLTGAQTAGLRTACLSGAFTTKLSEEDSDPRLSANDLDEAVSGLLADGKAAADVDGEVVQSGYQRLEAFRTGVLEGESACWSDFN